MNLIWIERVYHDGLITEGKPFYSFDSLVKTTEEDFMKTLSYFQKLWARRDDMETESSIQTFELPEELEDIECIYTDNEASLIQINEQGERYLDQKDNTETPIYIQQLDPEALNYRYYYSTYFEPIFGGVELNFEIPLLPRRNRILRDAGVYANSFEEAISKTTQ